MLRNGVWHFVYGPFRLSARLYIYRSSLQQKLFNDLPDEEAEHWVSELKPVFFTCIFRSDRISFSN